MGMTAIEQTSFNQENNEDATSFAFEFLLGASYKLGPGLAFTEMNFTFASATTIALGSGASSDVAGGWRWVLGYRYPFKM